MSKNLTEQRCFRRDGYDALNTVCDEFRRLLKESVLKLDHDAGMAENSDVTQSHVIVSARNICASDWLTPLAGPNPHDRKNRAA
jgi:hypothetical protein